MPSPLSVLGARAERSRIPDFRHPEPVDAQALERRLREVVTGEVRFDRGSRAVYSLDSSNYLQTPIGVVLPRTADDIIETIRICREMGAPVLPRGGGTSLTGSTCNVAVVLDMTKYYNQILEINPEERWVRVQPGIVLDHLRNVADHHGLTFGPDPSTHSHCALGGMIGNNSCGMHAQMAGRVSENVIELDILTYDGLRMTVGRTSPGELAAIKRAGRGEAIGSAGRRRAEIYAEVERLAQRYQEQIRKGIPQTERRVSGYNLDYLLPENGFDIARALVGSEGTLITVLEAKLRLIYDPAKRTVVTVGFDDIYTAAERVPQVLLTGPTAVEAMDHKLVEYVKVKGGKKAHELGILPEGQAFLMIEYGAESKSESDAKAWRLIRQLRDQGFARQRIKLYDESEQENQLWEIRESGLGATAFVPGHPNTWPGWEDAAVPPERLADYLRDYRRLLDKHGLDCSVYGHFGQGCVHCRITFDMTTKRGLANYRRFIEDAADLCSRYGGSYSGEHGDGQSRGELWPKMFGPELVEAMRDFKRIWDPEFKMNPGKLVGDPPYRMDENLRLGPGYQAHSVKTHFQFPDDEGTFNHATLRCVGVGKCRNESGGYMCPSWRVTHDEEHTTRGRAHILFDMVQGKVIRDGWKSEAVKEALDLCLACKGCKGDCPVSVDIATLKAEFLSHYYRGRLRPRYAYAMGWIHKWAQLASKAPRLANFVTQTPIVSDLAKQVGGIAPERRLPKFATETFSDWFARRPVKTTGSPVMLWPDTFNNYFHPEIGRATVTVLEDAGYRVTLPPSGLCCGRPLYDYGFLKQAKRQLRSILRSLSDPIEEGIPLVGMEPSCLAVFRDELVNLFPDDKAAQRLRSQSFLLAEFLRKKAKHYPLPRLSGKALIQGHCHQAAVIGLDAEKEVLQGMGLETEVLDAGCCGQAGSFGFEADKYDISMKIANHALVPKLKQAKGDELIVANGFSCHLQIDEAAGRKSQHVAQVLQTAIEKRTGRLVQGAEPRRNKKSLALMLGTLAAGLAIGFFRGRSKMSRRSR